MHYQQLRYGLAAPCVSMHHSLSAGNHSSPLRLPHELLVQVLTVPTGLIQPSVNRQIAPTCFPLGHSTWDTQVPWAGLSWAGVLWQTHSNQQDLEMSAAEEPSVWIQQLHPLEVHKQTCCVKRNGSLLTASARCFQRVWQNRALLRVMLLRRMPHYRGKTRNSCLFT